MLDRIVSSIGEGLVALDRSLRYVYMNDAAERLIGMAAADVLGRTPFDVLPPAVLDQAMPHVHAAMASGAPVTCDTFLPGVDRWFENRLYPSEDGITILFVDVTERRRTADRMRRREEMQALLVTLLERTRHLRDPDEVLWTSVQALGEHLHVGRCMFGEVDAAQQHVLVARDYVHGVGTVAGRHRLDDFGAPLADQLRAGRSFVVRDASVDPRTADPGSRAAFEAIGARALIVVPLVKEDRLVALLSVHQTGAREWSEDEVALLERVAEQTWFAVANARAEAALEQARLAADADAQRLHLALAAARLGDWRWDVATDVVTFSPRGAEIFGLRPGQVVTWSGILAALHADDAERARRAVEESVATHGDYAVEYRLLRDGRERWISARGRALYDTHGAVQGMLGVVQDVSHDRLLVRLDDAVRTMAEPDDITAAAVAMLGQHLGVDRCVAATIDDDGATFTVTVNYTHGLPSIVGTYRMALFGVEVERTLTGGATVLLEDVRSDPRLSADERDAYETIGVRSVACAPILKGGRLAGAMAVHCGTPRAWRPSEIELLQQVAGRCWESIERARVEQDRAALLARERLARQQAEVQNRRLAQLSEEAESASRTKDEFMAMLGHELRNPLAPILTALQLMRLRGDDGSERERIVIERQVNHLTRLVDDLLDVSRIARGKVELKAAPVEAAEVIARAIEMASPLLEQRTHTLAVEVPRAGLAMLVDEARMSQVVANLLTNAAKYTPPGGRITVTAYSEAKDVVVRVRDTGIGMTADVLPTVFDLFVQGRQSSDRAQGGLGLGLTIVRNLVERHGGSVSARSDGPGRGSEFTVRVPGAPVPAVREPLRAPVAVTTAADVPSARVLIVDDNEDAAEMLAHVLAARGHDIRVAHDGVEALRASAEFQPHAAFLDLGLPVMDGYELASRLRELPGLQDIRLIAVTGYGQESDRRRTRAAGFQHHLVKPVDVTAIEALLA